MGMNTIIPGFKARDEEWETMKKVYNACIEVGLRIHQEVDKIPNGATHIRVFNS